MSWSNSWVGRRAGIKAAMARFSNQLTGNSRDEFETARPHLEALVDLNMNTDGDPVLIIDANGHAYTAATEGGKTKRYCQVSVNLRSIGALCEEPADAEQPAEKVAG